LGCRALAPSLVLGALGLAGPAAGGVVRGQVTPAVPGIVVYLTGFDEPAPPEHVAIHQCQRRFVPALSVARMGQPVDFVNDDGFEHNVFSPMARFNMGRTGPGEHPSHVFHSTGPVDLRCDVHAEMRGALVVVPNHAFTRTGSDGRFELQKVPPGSWDLHVWSPTATAEVRRIDIQEGAALDVTLAVVETPEPPASAPHRPVGYVREGPMAAQCPDDAGNVPAAHAPRLAPVPAPAGPVSLDAPPESDVTGHQVRLLRLAADALTNAYGAKQRGDAKRAEFWFLEAARILGPNPLDPLVAEFKSNAGLVASPPKSYPLDAPPQPRSVAGAEPEGARPKREAASVSGEVQWQGKPLSRGRAVVWLEPSDGRGKPRAPQHRVIEQRGRQFAPELLVVSVGSTVSFPNLDPVFHNVFSRSGVKPFDLGLYPPGETREVTFDAAGVWHLGCNLHAEMSGYVVVVAASQWAVVDEAGAFRIDNVRPGGYRLHVWSEVEENVPPRAVTLSPGRNRVPVALSAGASAEQK
jgi:plastocyanin